MLGLSSARGIPAVQSDRSFDFSVPPAEVWAAIGAVDRYREWWPWLRQFEARGLTRGDVWRCSVQPPLPYRVSFEVRLDAVRASRRVAATIDGDVAGTAVLTLEPTPSGCTARLVSELSPHSRMLAAVAALSPPVARFGHDWILTTGMRQFVRKATV